MAIDIKFDLTNNPEPPTIILANRSGKKLGQLNVDFKTIDLSDKLNGASELSFVLHKSNCNYLLYNVDNDDGYIDENIRGLISYDNYILKDKNGVYLTSQDISRMGLYNLIENKSITYLWDEIVDFKLVYCKEWDLWFEINVELDESAEITKTVFCKQLGQAELSQILLHNIEINTELDIARDDYKPTVLYNSFYPEASLLHRLLKDKAQHYSIDYVDSTIKNIQRTFTFDNISIHEAFNQIAEEIGCLFIYNSNTGNDGKIQRTISVYDLQQNCLNKNCHHRGEFTDVCPKCGTPYVHPEYLENTDVPYGFGKDTNIFITSDELAENNIQFKTNVDSVKNCFKLEAGDDLMTATVRNCNPNGSDYIWRITDDMKHDMSNALVAKLESYDKLYKDTYNDYTSNLNVDAYNSLVNKYAKYDSDLKIMSSSIKGYPALMNAYYNAVDLALLLEHSLMPEVTVPTTNAKLESSYLSKFPNVAVNNFEYMSESTAENAILTFAKTLIRQRDYRIKINSSSLSENKSTWTGSFIITNYSNEEDTYTTDVFSIGLMDSPTLFTEQKIKKALCKEDTDKLSFSGLFGHGDSQFPSELNKYALNPLLSFEKCCQACLNILTQQGGNANSLYGSYQSKLSAIQSEIKVRRNELAIINGTYDNRGKLISEGLKSHIEKYRDIIQNELNFEKYLGDYWFEFCSYRREDKYENSNYISDGLNNAELFERASEFIDVANDEIYKSSELQHSISTTLKNLLAIPKFKPLIKNFKVGNWMRVQVNNQVYKLRLLEYSINFGDFNKISVEFSDVSKIKNGFTDIEDILNQASSMATSYDSVKRQATKGSSAKGTVDQWLSNGLNSALVNIHNNNTEDITIDQNGILCRAWDDVTESHDNEQLRITHNLMVYTDDNWQSVKQAIGKHDYTMYSEQDSDFVEKTGYGISADFVTAGIVSGSQIIGGYIYSDNYSKANNSGSYINLIDGRFSFAGGDLKYEDNKLSIASSVITEVIQTTEIDAQNLKVNGANITGKLSANTIEASEILVNGSRIDGSQLSGQITSNGNASDGLNISGHIEATSGKIGDFTINKSIYNDLGDIKAFSGKTNKTDDDSGDTTSGAQGVYIGIDGIRLGEDLKLFANGTMSAGKRIYIPNGRSLRGMKYNESNPNESLPIKWANSNALVWISGREGSGYASLKYRDRVILGNHNNSAATEIRSPNSIFFKCNGRENDETSNTIIFHQASNPNEPFFMPLSNGKVNLGGYEHMWNNFYAATSPASESDRNSKKDIELLNDEYLQVFDLLEPVSYKFINGTSNRTHTGFIAQDVEKALENVGLTSLDFAGLCKDKDENGEKYLYKLRYEEFIALNTAKIKQLEKRIIDLESEIKELKNNSN